MTIRLTRRERDEMADLAERHMNVVEIVDSSRHHATCHILAEGGARIEWKFLYREGEYRLVKTRLGDGPLTYQPHELYRLAWLRCKEVVASERNAHKKRNERLQANPSPRMKRRLAERRNRAAQKLLPLELHTHRKPRSYFR